MERYVQFHQRIDNLCETHGLTRAEFFARMNECSDHVILQDGSVMNPLSVTPGKGDFMTCASEDEAMACRYGNDSVMQIGKWLTLIGIEG